MARITQKNCVALFPVGPSKKKLFLVGGPGGRTDMNQQKHTKKLELCVTRASTICLFLIHLTSYKEGKRWFWNRIEKNSSKLDSILNKNVTAW